jgi:hypothetical protein
MCAMCKCPKFTTVDAGCVPEKTEHALKSSAKNMQVNVHYFMFWVSAQFTGHLIPAPRDYS